MRKEKVNPAGPEPSSGTLREEPLESTRPLHPVTLLPRRLGRHLRSGSALEGRQAWDHSQAILSHAENRSFQQLDREDRQPISEGLARLLRHWCGNGNRSPSIRHLQFHQQCCWVVQAQFKRWTDSSDNSAPWINNRMGYLSVYPSRDSRSSHSARISPRNSQCPRQSSPEILRGLHGHIPPRGVRGN